MNMRIQITLTNQDGQTAVHPIAVEAALPETGDLLIDPVEQAVIPLNKAAIRAAIVQYLEELSKKAQDAQATHGGTLTIHAIPYRVEGARGRFVFRTDALQEDRHTVWECFHRRVRGPRTARILPDCGDVGAPTRYGERHVVSENSRAAEPRAARDGRPDPHDDGSRDDRTGRHGRTSPPGSVGDPGVGGSRLYRHGGRIHLM